LDLAALDNDALMLVLMGMGVVFGMLTLLVVVVSLMHRLLAPVEAAPPEKKVTVRKRDQRQALPPEVVALMAVALHRKDLESKLRVSPATGGYAPSPWGRAGREELMVSRAHRTSRGR